MTFSTYCTAKRNSIFLLSIYYIIISRKHIFKWRSRGYARTTHFAYPQTHEFYITRVFSLRDVLSYYVFATVICASVFNKTFGWFITLRSICESTAPSHYTVNGAIKCNRKQRSEYNALCNPLSYDHTTAKIPAHNPQKQDQTVCIRMWNCVCTMYISIDFERMFNLTKIAWQKALPSLPHPNTKEL